ncbi:IPTL-CTERM sorting domain-containing protein [Delftia acidovorans]|uniref:IPTL-CTERM sorting domain-containing protein n=1 Tax=Delftia acidovorans TaxID=80866 RepID=UPI001EDE41EE|nr:IPTL-CTERM sorting domain-containing protein [Delftia acidovorans]MCG3783886.1 IPTL-CTERM sorting domain-containing protein [Delftia acidovorans]
MHEFNRSLRAALAALAALLLAGAAAAQAAAFTVGAGGGAYHGTIDLACGDLEVNGPLSAAGATFTGVGMVRIGAAGSIAAAGARIELGAGWHNAAGPGGFTGAASTVAVVGRCSSGGATDITGNTTFSHLSAAQAGQVLRFAAGSEQQVGGTLTLGDVAPQGQGGTAFLTLLPGGAQQIGAVTVAGVDASRGQWLAPTGQNGPGGSSAPGWFARPPTLGAVAVPSLGEWSVLLLSTLAGLLGWRRLRAPRGTTTPTAR